MDPLISHRYPRPNPVYDLLVECMDCADQLTLADHNGLLHDAIERAYEVIELPDWLPQFESLIAAMGEPKGRENLDKTWLKLYFPEAIYVR